MIQSQSKKKMKLPTHWKRWLFILWFALSYGWMISTAKKMQLRDAVNIHSSYNRYANKIGEGRATDYEKHLYRTYGPRVEAADKTIASFFLVGIALPCLILAGGTWLVRTKK
jgi:hypothetical protein